MITSRVWLNASIAVVALALFGALSVVSMNRIQNMLEDLASLEETRYLDTRVAIDLTVASDIFRGYLESEDPSDLVRFETRLGMVRRSMEAEKPVGKGGTGTGAHFAPMLEKLTRAAQESSTDYLGAEAIVDSVIDEISSTLAKEDAGLSTVLAEAAELDARMTAIITFVVPFAICVLIFLKSRLVAATVGPIRTIVAGLEKMAKGDLALRLPAMPDADLDWVAIVFNAMAERLQVETRHRETALTKLEFVNLELAGQTSALQDRTRTITILSRMIERFQAAKTRDELGYIIKRSGPLLFPDLCGRVQVCSSSRDILTELAAWNDDCTSSSGIAPSDCWALRQGRAHSVKHGDGDVTCEHFTVPQPWSLCLPMAAQGEVLGIVTLTPLWIDGAATPQSVEPMSKEAQDLAGAISEHIAMAVGNLKLRELLQNQSIRDPLTGLFNRRYMEESLSREFSRCTRTKEPISVVMLDVDHFKQFNDTSGHDVGDTVLASVGRHLRANIRSCDIACRYGGEEFMLILPGADLESATKRAEAIRTGIKQLTFTVRGEMFGSITVSLGVACQDATEGSEDSIVEAADEALRQAKREGRDRVVTGLLQSAA